MSLPVILNSARCVFFLLLHCATCLLVNFSSHFSPGSSLLCRAREGHTLPFSGRARRQPVIRHRISVWVVPVTPLSGILAFSPLPVACFGYFLSMCFLCFTLVSPVTACLCLDQFYENICWLIARSTLFL
jgi:hypothetical protein